MPSHRQRRVAEQIYRELSLLLMLDARDPRLADVTITAVDITPDLMLARVFFTVLAEGDAKASEAQVGLERATGFLRTQLAARLQLRLMPHLAFELDKSAAYGRRIDELLGELADANPRSEAEREERDNPIPDDSPRRSLSGDRSEAEWDSPRSEAEWDSPRSEAEWDEQELD